MARSFAELVKTTQPNNTKELIETIQQYYGQDGRPWTITIDYYMNNSTYGTLVYVNNRYVGIFHEGSSEQVTNIKLSEIVSVTAYFNRN